MSEIWLPVIGYEGYYEVSNYGKVKTCKKAHRIVNRYGHETTYEAEEKLLKVSITRPGYARVTLCVNKHPKTYSVHRLVLIAFEPNVKNLPQINHKDGNKLNNHLDNLEWCDQSHNIQHAFDTGLNVKKTGWEHNQSKALRYVNEGNEISIFGSIGEASKAIGIKRELISKSCRENRAIHHGKYKGAKFNFI
jgi:hypothetical protein